MPFLVLFKKEKRLFFLLMSGCQDIPLVQTSNASIQPEHNTRNIDFATRNLNILLKDIHALLC